VFKLQTDIQITDRRANDGDTPFEKRQADTLFKIGRTHNFQVSAVSFPPDSPAETLSVYCSGEFRVWPLGDDSCSVPDKDCPGIPNRKNCVV